MELEYNKGENRNSNNKITLNIFFTKKKKNYCVNNKQKL